ncbi:MAG: hypothetical protein KatS3mg002_0817 [Candidatus Woesearchaeota archaeon]|nr:MAG: hypothetical protein KatS3mg002_0817 [Candidatus Woesearchaeota archaeon]
MEKTPREQFIELMTENVKSNGLDDATSRIIAILFLEESEISLEELAKKSGYSLSLVSTAIKMMESFGLIHKLKKPHSKKVYVKMETDILDHTVIMLRRKQKYVVEKVKDTLPEIIANYKKFKGSKKELKIIEKYYNDTLIFDKIINDIINKINKLRERN